MRGVSCEPPQWPWIQAANGGNVTRILPALGCPIFGAAPAKRSLRVVDPAMAGDHLSGPPHPVGEQAERQADGEVDEIIVKRQELAVEQGKVDEAYGEAQRQHVEREMPPRPPRARNRDAG